MNIETHSETRLEAVKKWKQYVKAARQTGAPIYKDLAKVYNVIKCGRKVIDIHKAISKGGLDKITHHPRLAIARADNEFVWCSYQEDGRVMFTNGHQWGDQSRQPMKEDVNLSACLPTYSTTELFEAGVIDKKFRGWNRMELKAPVPLIPPHLLPTNSAGVVNLTKDYYILWEVEEWQMTPPTDPWLLRRITKNMFVVVAAWDLTRLEKAVMHGRLI